MKTMFSFAYNSYVFQRADFMNYLGSFGVVCWEVTAKEIMKNGLEFESDWAKEFLHHYGTLGVKHN
jgi:hypothetical protein